MKLRHLRALILALGLASNLQVYAGHWVAGRDLVANEQAGSVTELTNPNASVPEWSYGTRTTQTSATNDLSLYVASEHSNSPTTWEGWTRGPGYATVGAVTRVQGCPVPSGVIRQGEIIIHPQSNGFTVVRWTAPKAGTYAVSALWQDVDWTGGDGSNVGIVKNGTVVVFNNDFDNGSGAFTNHVLPLSAGDTLDFVIGIRANDTADTTRFNATVTTIQSASDVWVGGRDLAANEKPDGNANELVNPNGSVPQWSYGSRSTVAATTLNLYSNGSGHHYNGGGSDDDVEGWTNGDTAVLCNTGTVSYISNYGFGPNLPLTPGEMLVAPSSSGTMPVVRWTAPAAGRYEVFAYWQDLDPHGGNGISGHVAVNGSQQFAQDMDNGAGCSTVNSLTLAAGDQVDFLTGIRGGFEFDTTKFNVMVVRPSLYISGTSFPVAGGQVETAGGTGPFTFSVVGGALPGGLSLSSEGVVTGTPINGAYSVTLRVQDSLGATDDRVFSGTVELPVAGPAGIVAQWPGDNTVADIIGNNHLALQNSLSFTKGKVGRAFQFNGTDQSLQTTTVTDVMKHLPLTIEGWIKPEARTSGSLVSYLPTNVIANDRQNFGGHGFGAHLYPDGSMFKVGIEGVGEDFHTVPGVNFTDGVWVHVAVVYSPGNVKTYINGALVDSYNFTQGPLDGGDTIRIGRHNDDTGYGSLRFFKGAIDELTLYHRALSATNVALIYNTGVSGKLRDDAARDYSTTTANGPVWSYRWLPSTVSLSSYDPAEATSRLMGTNNGFDGNGIHAWITNASVTFNPSESEVIVNSGGTQYTWYPKQLGMGPGSGEQRPVVRWKAPADGLYAVSGTFYGADTLPTTVDVHIYHNSTQLSPDGIYPDGKRAVRTYRGNGVSHTQVIDAMANDTVDFVVGVGINGWSYDSSALTAFVTRVGDHIPTSGGSIAAWGQGANGALGNGEEASELSPVPVSMDSVLSGKIISAVAGGLSHSLALDTTGKVYAWGNNESGQLGEGSVIKRTTARAVNTAGALSGKTVTRIAACEGISFAVTSDGQLVTWGRSQPGSFTAEPTKQTTPVRVTGSLLGKTVVAVACGPLHTLALTSDGEIHTWGINHAGQLGSGTTTGRNDPAKMTVTGTALSGKTVTAIAVVGASSYALTSDGKVFAWGLNDFGQLGDGSVANRSLPVLLGGLLSSKTITAIASGSGRHQLALASDGTLFAWGDNTAGELGNGTTTSSNVPVAVTMTGVLDGLTVSNVYVGTDFSLVRTSDGQLFSWGTDSDGQVGDGISTANQQLEPVAVDQTTSLGGQFVVAAAAGATHALAVASGPSVQEIVVRDSTNADVIDGGTVNLGNQAVGTPAAPRTFTIRNAGAAPLNITSVTLSGGESSDFGLNASGAVGAIDPGYSRTFTISFTAGAIGPRSTTVNIVSDDADEATFDFTLTGSGATDFTPPTLDVIDSWVEKVGTPYAFKLLIDARDNIGIDKIQVRSKINTTAALPDTTPWVNWTWRRDEPVIVTGTASSIVIELRALDLAGNASIIQRRVFKAPIPLGTAPNLSPKFVSDKVFTGSTIDCRGLFGADFDGDGREDILQIDRTTGLVKIRKQQSDGSFVSNGFNVATNAISDSAIGDFDADGKPDIALVVSNALVVYHNDGPDGVNTLQFSVMNVQGLATTGISSVVGVTVGDVTGEGKDDIIISGTGDDGAMGTVAKIAVLINNGQFQLGASNNARAFPSSSAGPVRLGDVTGDGWTDAVMIDAANNQVLLFINKRNGSYGGVDDTDTAARPQATVTDDLPPQAIAVGDVTGDGRPDVVVTLHSFEALEGVGTERDHLFGQLLDSRGASPLHANPPFRIGQGDLAASGTTFRSDVILQDLNGDRFPEAIFTNPFEAGTPKGGVRALRFTCLLDNSNTLSTVTATAFGYPTGAPDPHRLGTVRYASTRPDIMLASGGSEQVQIIFSTYTELSKTYDLATGASTDSDPNGTLGNNDAYVYDVQIGGVISYSINYVNNSTTAITSGVVECLLPANLSIESGDAGYTTVPSGTSKYIRWTEPSIPAGSSGVKRFTVRVVSGIASTGLEPKVNFKRGTTVLVTKTMPKVVLEEPLLLTVTALTDSDSFGQKVHVDELITYRMKVKNRGTGPVSGFKLSSSVPPNTSLHSGTSPPATVLTGTFPKYTAVTWPNLTLAAGESITLDLRVRVESTAVVGKTIDNATITVTRSDNQKIVSPKSSIAVVSPLEITLKANKSIVQPGDTIRYTFTARNWMTTAVTNAKVVNQLPQGVSLLKAGANDAVDAPSGNGNFVFSAGTFTAAQLSTTTLPAFDKSTGIMTWVLGSVPAGAQRNIEFDVIVKQDIPTFFNANGVSTTMEVQNKSYNFVASSSTNVRLFASTAVGGSAANSLTATSDKLLSTSLTARRTLLSDPPLDEPRLVLTKSATADGKVTIAGEEIATVINDSSITTDGLCDYHLTYSNFGAGTAINCTIRDYVPTNMVFVGNLRINNIPVPVNTFIRSIFYDAAGNKMSLLGAEGFTDTNGNGFYDVGETYTDANNNKRYDGVTASLVKSIDFVIGDVPHNDVGIVSYRTKTSSNPGITITSDAGGLTGVKNGLDYTKVKGYHLTADNLHFPVNGSPKQVKVLVTGPATFDFPYEVIKSRPEMVGSEVTQIAIPFALIGGSSLTLANTKITITIPKGYLVPTAEVQDLTTPTPNSRAAIITQNASTKITTVTFPIDSWKEGNAIFQVQLDPANKSALKGTNGQIKAPLRIEPTISGGYRKPGSPNTIVSITTGLTRLLDTLQVRDNITPPPAPALAARAVPGAPAPAPIYADAKIFVGRCAPVSVKRGDTFGVTIFVGNLTNIPLGIGTIEMNVPSGCDYVSGSLYTYNLKQASGADAGSAGFSPTKTGSKVQWTIGNFMPYEGGAVTLTLKVREDFTGTRIDDNSCIFDVVNACGKTPGPIGVVVRAANDTTQSNEIALSAAAGLGSASTNGVSNALTQTFALSASSCSITVGGADIVQLGNGVVLIQLGSGRVLTVGPPDKILATGIRLVKDDAMIRVAAGPGDNSGVRLTKLPTLASGVIQSANLLVSNLQIPSASLVAAGGGNLVAAGGGNLVAAGGGNLVAAGGGNLVGPDGGTIDVPSLVAAGGGNLVAAGGGNLVAAGGGNLVAAGGGNLVAAGGGNVLAASGKNPLVAAGGGNLVAAGGGNLVAAGGGNLVAAGAGNLVAAGGGNLVPNPK